MPMDVLEAQQQKWQQTWKATDDIEKFDSYIAPAAGEDNDSKYTPEKLVSQCSQVVQENNGPELRWIPPTTLLTTISWRIGGGGGVVQDCGSLGLLAKAT